MTQPIFCVARVPSSAGASAVFTEAEWSPGESDRVGVEP